LKGSGRKTSATACRRGDLIRHQEGQSRTGRGARRKLPVVRRAEMLAELMRLKSNIAIAGHAWQDDHDDDGGDPAGQGRV
jgi:hypothetical protein